MSNQKYFNLFITNHNTGYEAEKVVSARSEDYIIRHQSKYVGKNVTIDYVDSTTYFYAENHEDVDKIMGKRFGFKTVSGRRVYK